VFSDVVRDAARQYRRRPLAGLLLAVLSAGLLLELAPEAVQAVAWLPLTVVSFVAELFVIAWLAGVIDRSQRTAGESLRAAVGAIWPALKASMLELCYVAIGLLVGLVLFGRAFDTSPDSVAVLMAGTAPLVAFGLAFLAVLVPPLVIDGERKVLLAAARSHRVAARYFPICLLIGLGDAADMALRYQRWSTQVLLGVLAGMALLRPFVLAMATSLYLRTRQEALAERPAA
jgi:hypothetical protein